MLKFLYICPSNPYAAISGGHQRSNLICQSLAEMGRVDIVYFESIDEKAKYYPIRNTEIKQSKTVLVEKESIFNRFLRIFSFFSTRVIAKKNKQYSQLIDKVLDENNYDYIVVRYLDLALKCGIELNKKVIIDLDDLPEQLYLSLSKRKSKNLAESIVREIYYSFLSKMAKIQTSIIVKKIYHAFLPDIRFCIYGNSSFLPNIPYPRDDDMVTSYTASIINILFIGKMTYRPNLDGISYFIKNIWPIVVNKQIKAELRVIGAGVPEKQKVNWNNQANIHVVGFVDDVIEEYNRAKIVIAPVYEGAGTNIKVLEGMYFGKCCVVTQKASCGFEDILVDGYNILIAKNDEEFRRKLEKVLHDENYCEYIAINAKKSINNSCYSFDSFSKSVRDIFN